MNFFTTALLGLFAVSTPPQYPLKFLDCPGNRPTPITGLLRRCCDSRQLPNNCECFDISPQSGFVNTVFHKPQCPNDLEVTFKLYNRVNTRGIRLRAGSSLPATFDGSKPTKFLTHGYTAKISKSSLEIKDAFLALEDVNVITVDWRRGARGPNYYQATANTRTVGAIIARLILDMKNEHGASLDSFHLIGHSLGAHVMGSAGEEIKRLTGQKISRITGLDPAGPAFERYLTDLLESYQPWVRLDSSDAQFVDVIHTNAKSLFRLGYGIRKSVGDVDFWPNGGRDQPGCPKKPFGISSLKGRGACSHGFAINLFLSSLTGCTWGDTCTMGYHVSRHCRGNYYPTTTSKWPFC